MFLNHINCLLALALIALVFAAGASASKLKLSNKAEAIRQLRPNLNYTILNDTIYYNPIIVIDNIYVTIGFTISAPSTDIYNETIVISIRNNYDQVLTALNWNPDVPYYATAYFSDPPCPIGIKQTASHTIQIESYGMAMSLTFQYQFAYNTLAVYVPPQPTEWTGFPCNS